MGTKSKLIHEPIFHFLFLGCVLYAGAMLHTRMTDPKRIVVSDAIVKRLASHHTKQFGSAPSPDRLEFLVNRYIQDEALYRQGTAMGLGMEDEIIRRRIIQKIEFLSDGGSDGIDPTDDELRAYFDAHSSRYLVPERVSFSHIYFSPDKGGDAKAYARATVMRERLNDSSGRSFVPSGDFFPDRLTFVLEDREEVTRIFGKGELTQALFSSSVGQWLGPIRSGYGWHLVRVQERQAQRAPDFTTVVEDVHRDWRNDQMNQRKHDALQRIVAQYQVIRDDHVRDQSGKK